VPALIVAVAVIGVLCLLNLLLTFGVIRRLREHTKLLDATMGDAPVIRLGVGERPTAISTVTTGGDPIGDVTGLQVVGFFSTSCPICPERVPLFTEYLTRHGLPADRTLAVICGPRTEPAPYQARLEKVTRVSLEEENGELTGAFKVVGYPAFCVLDAQGTVVATGYHPEQLPAPVAA
jgi:hypothetical protein